MKEPIRLVIWDLDETFWKGTLSEGGIREFVQAHNDLVVELARRGIMSSICSKNDFETARKILVDQSIWDYFILPSIDWAPKGARVAALVKSVQLRPETILFIDDNPQNRGEVEAAVPGIQVAAETIIPELSSSPLFKGKDDRGLTRLAQYKLLEARKRDEASAGSGNIAFLESCNIRVEIDVDVETHIDRALELIQRTNQLNFTKKRLSENPEEAKRELLAHTRSSSIQAGLVKVSDKYGDHGYCGFFSKFNANNQHAGHLLHYCFSCRILGMGVEHWIYEKLKRPQIDVRGEVLSDLGERKSIHWINCGETQGDAPPSHASRRQFPEIRLRGGCEIQALSHYFTLSENVTCIEANYPRDSVFFVRKSNSPLLLAALENRSEVISQFLKLGFTPEDVKTRFMDQVEPGSLLIYSGWADLGCAFYRHRKLGFRAPVPLLKMAKRNLIAMPEPELQHYLESGGADESARNKIYAIQKVLAGDYEFEPTLDKAALEENLREIFRRVPASAVLALVLPHHQYLEGGTLMRRPAAEAYGETAQRIAADFDNVILVPIADFVFGIDDREEGAEHFHRQVYHRLFDGIAERAIDALGAEPLRRRL